MKDVKDMTIGDVVKLTLFDLFLSKSIVYYRGQTNDRSVKSRAFLRLEEKGVMNAKKLKSLYKKAMNKELSGFSSNERNMILKIGNQAFNLTIKVLLKREKTRNIINRGCQ